MSWQHNGILKIQQGNVKNSRIVMKIVTFNEENHFSSLTKKDMFLQTSTNPFSIGLQICVDCLEFKRTF